MLPVLDVAYSTPCQVLRDSPPLFSLEPFEGQGIRVTPRVIIWMDTGITDQAEYPHELRFPRRFIPIYSSNANV